MIDDETKRPWIEQHGEPAAEDEPFDVDAIARAVAEDLAQLYGGRLKSVLLYGSWARGDAHPDSDVDLLVILNRVDSAWTELRRMDPVLETHSERHGTVIAALIASEAAAADPDSPALIRGMAEGRRIA